MSAYIPRRASDLRSIQLLHRVSGGAGLRSIVAEANLKLNGIVAQNQELDCIGVQCPCYHHSAFADFDASFIFQPTRGHLMKKTTSLMVMIAGLLLAGASTTAAQTPFDGKLFVSVNGGGQTQSRTVDNSGSLSVFNQTASWTTSRVRPQRRSLRRQRRLQGLARFRPCRRILPFQPDRHRGWLRNDSESDLLQSSSHPGRDQRGRCQAQRPQRLPGGDVVLPGRGEDRRGHRDRAVVHARTSRSSSSTPSRSGKTSSMPLHRARTSRRSSPSNREPRRASTSASTPSTCSPR